MEYFFTNNGVARCLRKMNDYGILAAYLKPFSKIVGMMQFDLFHIYTVDEHTLAVFSYARYMSTKDCKNKYNGLCMKFLKIYFPEILYLGAIFHDIARAKKKDHLQRLAQKNL